jgi:hypothetical protein
MAKFEVDIQDYRDHDEAWLVEPCEVKSAQELLAAFEVARAERAYYIRCAGNRGCGNEVARLDGTEIPYWPITVEQAATLLRNNARRTAGKF